MAKQYLADYLDKWTFVEKCPTCRRVQGTKQFQISQGFAAHVERRLAPLRMDVMLTENGVNCVALEVFHTHAVDQDKANSLSRQNIQLIEVRADEVIDAYNNGTYRVEFRSSKICQVCSHRPCVDCYRSFDLSLLTEVAPPIGFKYPQAFVCDQCFENCPSCGEATYRDQINRRNFCLDCEESIKRQRLEIAEQQNKEKLKFEEDKKNDRSQIEKSEKIGRSKIIGEYENEWWLLKKDLNKPLIEERKRAEKNARAEAIVKADRVNLNVTYFPSDEEKFEARRLGVDWDRAAKKWWIPANKMKVCERWLSVSDCELISLVEQLLKKKNGPQRTMFTQANPR
ncbi:MAG: DUF5710 domain-containing protein [Myxococcaceae bacterium]